MTSQSPGRQIPGLRIDCLGDCGPFSRIGDSIGYRVSYAGRDYLVDCGFPIFRDLGFEGVGRVRGILITHSHDDHRRWLTDFALFRYYTPFGEGRPRLLAIDDVQAETEQMTRPALERTLSAGSDQVINVAFENFFDRRPIGPAARYRISGDGGAWRVVDRHGDALPPEKAKVVFNPRDPGARPRLLYRDSATGLWVEPDTYYDYEDTEFYEEDQRPFVDESGLTFRAVKAISWHGMPTTSVLVETPDEQVLFSSDTVFDPDLWERLASERRPSRASSRAAAAISVDMGELVEVVWSRHRLERARKLLSMATLVLHDVAARASVVHTDYPNLGAAGIQRLFLVHSPDRFVSRYPLGRVCRSIRLVGSDLFEQVEDRLYQMSADVYIRDLERSYVGFAADDGAFEIVEDDGLLDVAPAGTGRQAIARIDLYRVFEGGYYRIGPGRARELRLRPDGRVEEIAWGPAGSKGAVVDDRRPELETYRMVSDLVAVEA